MIEFLRKAVHWIYRLLPKWNHAVIWGWPDYEDSVLALEAALQRTQVDRVYLLMTDCGSLAPVTLGAKTRLVRKYSPQGWLCFCFARYVFFTHRCFMKRFPRNVVSVNVWHGMPIKRIGWMLEGDEGIVSSHVLATSPFWAKIMEESLRPGGVVLDAGLPRNDRLFTDKAGVWRKLGIEGRADVTRLVAWLPTYRKSVRGELRVDGKETGNVFEMADVDAERLNAYLAERRAYAVVKPHPMADFVPGKQWSHLLMIDDAGLHARGLSLYEMLGGTDALVSDISSVVIDYLVLDRPVIHAFPDLQEYRESRGFSVEPIEDYFMGPVATTFGELTASLDAVFEGEDPESGKRRKMRELSHTHTDARAAERVLEKVMNIEHRTSNIER